MVALGDAGLGNVHAHLPALRRTEEFGERPAIINVGLQIVSETAQLVIAQKRRVELLGERAFRQIGHAERLAGVAEALEQPDDFAERRPLRSGREAIAPRLVWHAFGSLVVATLHVAHEGLQHGRDQIVDIQKLELDRRIVHVEFAVVRDGVAERRHGGVVVRPAPFAVQVRKPVHVGACPRAARVLEQQFFARKLALAVGASSIAAAKRRLHGAREHHGAGIAVLLEEGEQRFAEIPVALHEFGLLFGAVHARQVEDEVGLGAIALKLADRALAVVFEHRERQQLPVPFAAVFPVADILQRLAEVAPHETPRPGYEDLHLLHRLMLAALEGQLHVFGGFDFLHRARDIEPLGVVARVGFVGLGLHFAVNHELIVIEVAGIARDAVVAAHVLGAQALLTGHKRLEELLAVAGADHLGAHAAENFLDRLGEVADGRCGRLLDEQIARVCVLEGEFDQIDGLVEIHEETGHVGIGDREGLALANSVDEQRNNRPARTHHVAVARAADGGAASAVAGVGVDD